MVLDLRSEISTTQVFAAQEAQADRRVREIIVANSGGTVKPPKPGAQP